MSEPKTMTGGTLNLFLHTSAGLHDMTRFIVDIEAEAAALERERLRQKWVEWSPPCSCGLVQMYGDQLPWGVDHAPKCEANPCDPLVTRLLAEPTP